MNDFLRRSATCVALASSMFLSGCDDKPVVPAPTPIVAPPVAPTPVVPAAPAVNPGEHAAAPAVPKAAEKKGSDTPDIAPPKTIEAPADVKEKVARGMEDEKPMAAKKGGKALPPEPPKSAEQPTAAAAQTEVPTGVRTGRQLPPGFDVKPDGGK